MEKIIIDLPFIAPSLNEFYANTNPYLRSSVVKKIKNDVQWLLLAGGLRQTLVLSAKTKWIYSLPLVLRTKNTGMSIIIFRNRLSTL